MKHIIIEAKLPNVNLLQAFVIIFSKTLIHKDVFEANKLMLEKYKFTDIICISAGEFDNGEFHGESTSLEINTHPLVKAIYVNSIYSPVYEYSMKQD